MSEDLSNPETQNRLIKELQKKTTLIVVGGKTQQSGCSLADLVATSGIDEIFPHLKLTFKTDSVEVGADYEIVAKGGPAGEIPFDYLAGTPIGYKRPFVSLNQNDLWVIGLLTYATDNSSRPTTLTVGLQGIDVIDPQLSWAFFQSLFPKIKFQAFEKKPSFDEVRNLAQQRVIPHLPLDLK